MKVIAFNGSPRKKGNTAILINKVFDELHKENIETEMINIGQEHLMGCMACGYCKKQKNMRCKFDDDALNSYIPKMVEADGIIIGSPVYFADVTAQMKAFIDRVGYVTRANDMLLKNKVGASVVAVRRAGAVRTFDTLNHFLHISEMIIPGASYWNLAIGKEPGEVESDEEGIKTMQSLGQNMLRLLTRLN